MKKSILFILPISFLLGTGCKKTPTACISADKSEALTDESVTFTSCSENSEKISWDFGDGKTEEGNSVAHAYSKAGTYLVKMSAFSKKDKKWDKTSMIITISDLPGANFYVSTKTICEGQQVYFYDNSTNAPTSWSWTFNGGSPATSSAQFPVVTYNTAGVYNVTLIVTNSFGNNTITKNSYITVDSCFKKRYLTNIVLKSFAAKNPNNDDWDSGAELFSGTGPEPDVFVKFGLSSGEWAVTTSTISDAKISNVPKTWIYTPQNIYLASNDWEVTIRESDVLGSEEMQKWTANLATDSASNGVISLSSPSYSLDIYFEER